MNIRCFTDLWTVVDLVHDRWFRLSEVRFDEKEGEVVIFLGEKRKGPYKDRQLKITGAVALEAKDQAKIDQYDLSDIELDASTSTIRIKSGFPLELVIRVGENCSISVLKLSS